MESWGPTNQENLDSVSLAELTKMTDQLFEIDQKKKDLKKAETELNKKKAELERTIYAALEAHGLRDFKGTKAKVFFKNITSARVIDSEAFRESIGEDTWQSLATINSRTLNSWFKTQKEEAEENGNYDYQLEGVEYSEFTQLAMRKV